MGAFNLTKASCGLALVVCALMISQANSYSYTMDQMCAQWWDTGYIGNPSNCRAWGYCQGQKLVSWGTCKTGLVYNSQTGACANASTTICSTSIEETCQAAKSPVYVANPNNCTQYGYCFGNGTYGIGDCPTNQMFMANATACRYATTCPQDTICRFMKSDIFVGNPNNCGSYLQCINGAAVPGTCPDKYPNYNAATGRCELTSTCSDSGTNTDSTTHPNATTVCQQYVTVKALADGDTTTTTTTEATTTTTEKTTATTTDGTGSTGDDETSTTEGSSTTSATQYFTDNTTCSGYYACTSYSAVGSWNACKQGTHFNPTLKQCVSPAAYDCPYNRCNNMDITFMTQIDTKCNTYVNCNTLVNGTCPTDNPYFNEVRGYCQNTDPGYTICANATAKSV
ncbi:peritrophin-44 [Drosophila willistoni]|uniref:peritrophin-44 n=1 Tax=Drosophila willistoni TaxID=7260 RepID=UPI001F07E1F9|nr:peritrophin-44 [Drosophila willistoni]